MLGQVRAPDIADHPKAGAVEGDKPGISKIRQDPQHPVGMTDEADPAGDGVERG